MNTKLSIVFAVALITASALIVGLRSQDGQPDEDRVVADLVAAREVPPSVLEDADYDPVIYPIPVQDPESCETGSGDWSLQNRSGEGNRIISAGAESVADEIAAAKQDPFVARTLLVNQKAAVDAINEGIGYDVARTILWEDESIPTLEELRCVGVRQALVSRAIGILETGQTRSMSLGQSLDLLQIEVPAGTTHVAVLNQAVINGEPLWVEDTLPLSDEVLVTEYPNGAKFIRRTYCDNAVKVVPEPTVEPTPTNTLVPPTKVPPKPTSTQVPPTKVPPTPTSTPVPPTKVPPTPTSTPVPPTKVPPMPTFTPPPSCCPTAENTPPADGGTPIRPTATPRPTRTPLPQPTQDRPDPDPLRPTSVPVW